MKRLSNFFIRYTARQSHGWAHAGHHLFAADDGRCGGNVLEAAVGAGAQERLLNARPRYLRERRHIVHAVRAGDVGLQIVSLIVKFNGRGSAGIRV